VPALLLALEGVEGGCILVEELQQRCEGMATMSALLRMMQGSHREAFLLTVN
jgi:hypothetical protein